MDAKETAKVIVTIGPPGTGKTTDLRRRIAKAKATRGKNAIFVASLTNTAANEIANKTVDDEAIGLNPAHVGTLHSLCYRATEGKKIAELHVKEWNEKYPKYPMTARTAREGHPENDREDTRGGKDVPLGDTLLEKLSLYRHRMTSIDVRDWEVKPFEKEWTQWKKDNGYVDFTDMIEFGTQMEGAPGGCTLGVADEVQDFSRLEWACLLNWAKHLDYLLVSGDDQQALYSWRGADPGMLLHMDPPPIERFVLPRSYRLPQKIQAFCETWAEKLSERSPRFYAPREEKGSIHYWDTYRNPERLLSLCEQAIKEQKELLILTACTYQLSGILACFRKHGVPFSNRWRPARGDWNPLAPRKGVSTTQRLLAYVAPNRTQSFTWTLNELKQWLPLIKSEGALKSKAKRFIEDMPASDEPVSLALLGQVFEPTVLSEVLASPHPHWLHAHVLSEKRQALSYPTQIANRYGIEALSPKTYVSVGTIHSVKGGEVDWCVVFPDLSPSGYDEWQRWGTPARDSVVRQFYVACSRARERLYLGASASAQAISWR